MTLHESDRALPSPWQPPLSGRLERLVVESELLAGNPLGDPALRPLWVYLPASATAGGPLPTVYVIQGFTGQLDMWDNRSFFEPNLIERLDRMFGAGDCPPAAIVFVDAWTSLGGSQFINSSSTGPYMDYLCDEIVPFVDQRYPTLAAREHRGLTGKSSGGYGALVVPMLRPDVFGALNSHAGDALFEHCCLPGFAAAVRALRDHFDGSYDVFFQQLGEADPFRFETHGRPLEMYAYAAAYSPDPNRPGRALLPFEPETGRLVDEVWQRWLAWDPVRMIADHVDALRSMRRIHLDAGRSDEFFLDLGAQAVSLELTRVGVNHSLELFDGTHSGLSYRYPGAIRDLVLALTPDRHAGDIAAAPRAGPASTGVVKSAVGTGPPGNAPAQ